MPGRFEFKGINSREHDLITKSVNRPIFPSMRPRTSSVYSKNGIIDYGNNNFETRQITMHVAYVGKTYVELRQRARQIAAWLYTTEWTRLIIDDEPDKYYLARVYGQIDFETLQRLGECDITFECQPFAYMVISTAQNLTWHDADMPWLTDIPWLMDDAYTFDDIIANASIEFDNPGTININQESPQGSKFDIKITGTWATLSIQLNGKTINYPNAGTGTLTIDNIDMEVDLDGVNKLSVITGDIDSFLTCIPGQNTLNITGTTLDISVVVDFIPMWI